MPFCTQCGKQIFEDVEQCRECAAEWDKVNQTAAEEGFSVSFDTVDAFEPGDIEANKVMALLAYLSCSGVPMFVVTLLAAPNSKFARFHANQAIVLYIATLFLTLSVIGWVLLPVALVFAVLGIIRAASGQAKRLPFIGTFTVLKP